MSPSINPPNANKNKTFDARLGGLRASVSKATGDVFESIINNACLIASEVKGISSNIVKTIAQEVKEGSVAKTTKNYFGNIIKNKTNQEKHHLVAIATTLSIAVGLTVASAVFPPMLIAVPLAIALALVTLGAYAKDTIRKEESHFSLSVSLTLPRFS